MKRFLWTMLCAIALNARADDAAILDKDFQTMMAWLPGVYDNQEQVYFEEEQGVDEALRHQRGLSPICMNLQRLHTMNRVKE